MWLRNKMENAEYENREIHTISEEFTEDQMSAVTGGRIIISPAAFPLITSVIPKTLYFLKRR